MENLMSLLQIGVALSVVYVWVFRYHNVIIEFKQFELSDITRNFVGASKISLSTLLITGIWYPSLIYPSAIIMAMFMVSAQYFHFKIKNPFIKHLPSLILLVLCIIIALLSKSL